MYKKPVLNSEAKNALVEVLTHFKGVIHLPLIFWQLQQIEQVKCSKRAIISELNAMAEKQLIVKHSGICYYIPDSFMGEVA